MVCMGGRFGNYPPGDEEVVFAFSRTPHDPTLTEMMSGGDRTHALRLRPEPYGATSVCVLCGPMRCV